jgi:hypothetical protein
MTSSSSSSPDVQRVEQVSVQKPDNQPRMAGMNANQRK